MSTVQSDEIELSSMQQHSDDAHTAAALFSERFQLLCDPQRIVGHALGYKQQPPVSGAGAAEAAVANASEAAKPDPEQQAPNDNTNTEKQQQQHGQRLNGAGNRGEIKTQPLPGLVFIIGAIEKLLATKEGKRRDASAALEKALQALKPFLQPQTADNNWLSRSAVDVVLEALDILCVAQASASTLVVVLDCIEKLVSFHYFDNVVGLPTTETVAQRLRSNYQSSTSKVARAIDDETIEREAAMEAELLYVGFFRSVADRLVGMVTRCFVGEATAEQVQLQIVRALFALLSSDRLPVRQSSMLATIRTAYNVFVQTRSHANQTIAQGTLTQMVHMVLSRVPVEKEDDDIDSDIDATTAESTQSTEPSTGAIVENGQQQQPPPDDGAARDAFLLLRALCKLSMRQIPNDHVADGKSPQLRARCLALNLIRLALSEHTAIFTSSYVYLRSASASTAAAGPQASSGAGAGAGAGSAAASDGDEFGDTEGPDNAISEEITRTASRQQHEDQADSSGVAEDDEPSSAATTVAVPLVAVMRQYLSLSLSRNLVSSNAMVLDLGLAVFELTMTHVRAYLRREMEVIFREIMLPLLENKSSGSLHQRGRMLQTLGRLLGQPQLVVELYLNYDCAEDSRVNVFQRLAEIMCKLGGGFIPAPPKSSPHYLLASASNADAWGDGASVVATAWRAVQQRQTAFNMPVAMQQWATSIDGQLSSRSSGQIHHGSSTDSAAVDNRRRSSRTLSTGNSRNSLGGGMGAYGGLDFGASDSKSSGTPHVDEYMVRQWALDGLAAMLQSMVLWSDGLADPRSLSAEPTAGTQEAVDDEAPDEAAAAAATPGEPADDHRSVMHEGSSSSIAAPSDDPQELSSIKKRKEKFQTGSRLFAQKPKKGIEAWRSGGFIKSDDPRDVARFLHASSAHGIDKLQLGEYLGEGDAYNIAVMHAFVDQMAFSNTGFVPALRQFLQAFRLPGESQKIDRFMLKFAERYVMGNPHAGFANADAAYVLAYSTVMLNTDQHSPQVKHRMGKPEFVNMNRGINDGSNLDPQLLGDIYDEVSTNEIKMKDDPLEGRVLDGARASSSTGSPLFVLWGNGTANKIREQHAHASVAMAAKSEQSIRGMARIRRKRGPRRASVSIGADEQMSPSRAGSLASLDTWAMLLDASDYLHATRPEHVASMFGAVWTAVLAALSSPMQTSSDPHVVAPCLVGFQSGIAITSRFRMQLERTTFVTTLRNFTQLQNLAEMRRKHVEAIRALVEVAASRSDVGDGLAENWLDVLQCVSQLERLQLLTQGSEATHGQNQRSNGRRASSSTDAGSIFGLGNMLSVTSGAPAAQSISARAFAGPSSSNVHESGGSTGSGANSQVPTVLVAELAKLEANSQVLVVTVDRLFTSSVHLSGLGIVDFVRALSQVAWGEITAVFTAEDAQQSRQSTSTSSSRRRQNYGPSASAPSRLFSLSKIVEIAYYNMERIRVEWSQIWAILGPLFDRVGAHSDTRAALFALDSLRQLSMKFLEKEELPHFAFQKEFLRPFADILEGYIPESSPIAAADTGSAARGRSRVVAVDPLVKDMVLRCVHQLVQAAAAHIRSGWKAILNVSQIAARDNHDTIAEMGFHIARDCAERHGPQMWTLTTVAMPLKVGGKEKEKPVDTVSVSGLEYYYELIDCLKEFAVGAGARRPKFALGAIDTLYVAAAALGKQVLAHADFAASNSVPLDAQPLYRVWMPSLRALHEIVMHTEDLEVRTRALDKFFRLVMHQGRHFSSGLWASVLRDLVFTMFADLRDPSASKRFATVDDLELWFSTTLIKALRHLVALFTEYYPAHLSNTLLADILELLFMCIAQPSEVLGKIGTSCLQDLVRSNFTKWDDDAWSMVCDTFARLFNWSQPRELFSIAGASWESEQKTISESAAAPGGNGGSTALPVVAPPPPRKTSTSASRAHAATRPSPLRTGGSAASLLSPNDGNETPSPLSAAAAAAAAADTSTPNHSNHQEFKPAANGESKPDYAYITLKCILQLSLIQTIGELFAIDIETGAVSASMLVSKEDLYRHLPAHHLFILLDCLDQSRVFASRFNMNRKVRRRLVEMGVMPSMPSLLKQETGSVLVELHILQRMHSDAVGVEYLKTQGIDDAVAAETVAERETVSDEVDDRLAALVQIVLTQYCTEPLANSDSTGDKADTVATQDNAKDQKQAGSTNNSSIYKIQPADTLDTTASVAKRCAIVTVSWRPSVLLSLRHIMRLAKSPVDSKAKPFRAAVARLYPHLVQMIGFAVRVRDLEVIGAIQRVLATAGAEMAITSTQYTVE
ncbi:guanine nucleotide exchange protein for ADP-robosylation factor [Coemansia sp. RSA 1813]|nr:guanine nucleotide exchange protein for ADP-robosylation factor [Coemansia sp. RSA 986]KAJ2213669.1 guanine nucleotide exchange protein for ADP-robosylation factor [Coemansia sp. RSA 487]KAJ2568614.1 guanine nucleotide exchange protein for ADP-robosylation factor [Coemansia sp. RSA 1813]